MTFEFDMIKLYYVLLTSRAIRAFSIAIPLSIATRKSKIKFELI